MDLFELTRALIDIESITGNEEGVGDYLFAHLSELAARHQGRVEKMEVAPRRFNVFPRWGEPVVTLSTHMDTVPPHVACREDAERIWGRGACDAKGIIASMIQAAQQLLEAGECNFGLLFVVGEEKNSAGAMAAARNPRGSRYLINGEPSDNQLALGSKGALRYEVTASGKMAHSAYPELGESAIDKLLDVLQAIRGIPLPVDPVLGPGTLNIGTIAGGRAPNVVADSACAEVMFRLVDDADPLREAVASAELRRKFRRSIRFMASLPSNIYRSDDNCGAGCFDNWCIYSLPTQKAPPKRVRRLCFCDQRERLPHRRWPSRSIPGRGG